MLWQPALAGGRSVTAVVLIRSCSETHVTTCCSDRLLISGWKLPPRHTSSCRLRRWEVRRRVMLFIKQKALSRQLCHQCETMTHSSHFDTGPRSKPLPVLRNFIVGRVFYCLFYLAALDKAAARGFAAFSRESLDVAWEPAGRVPADGLWQWPRSAQTSRWCAFHWTRGLWEPNVPPPSPQRPGLLSPRTAAQTVTVGAAALRLVLDALVLVCKKVRNITSCTTGDHIQVSW